MSNITTVSSSLIATPASRRSFMRSGGALSAVAVALLTRWRELRRENLTDSGGGDGGKEERRDG